MSIEGLTPAQQRTAAMAGSLPATAAQEEKDKLFEKHPFLNRIATLLVFNLENKQRIETATKIEREKGNFMAPLGFMDEYADPDSLFPKRCNMSIHEFIKKPLLEKIDIASNPNMYK